MAKGTQAPVQTGKVIAVHGSVVDVVFNEDVAVPVIKEVLQTGTYDGQEVILEAVEYKDEHTVRCFALTPTFGLSRGAEVRRTHAPLSIPQGDAVLGRVVNVLGKPIDRKGPIEADERFSVWRSVVREKVAIEEVDKGETELIETGIKMIDLLFPLMRNTKTGIIGGAALGKSLLTLEIIHNIIRKQKWMCVFTGAGERIREGNELYFEFLRSEILPQSVLVFGQMDESPGARFEARPCRRADTAFFF